MFLNQQTIGVFDTGVGGLTALRTLEQLLPGEHFVYFGDTARMPYGPLSRETIQAYARQDAAFLATHDPKALVIACGTITTAALELLQKERAIPIVGVVEPSCQRAAAATGNGRVGVVATEASIRSGAYEKTLRSINGDLQVFSQACPRLAPLAEQGHFVPGDPEGEAAVREYTQSLRDAGVDTLILGCTHYPLFRDIFAACMGPSVELIDAGAAAAGALAALLETRGLAGAGAPGRSELFVSGDPAAFESVASVFLGRDVTGQTRQIDITAY